MHVHLPDDIAEFIESGISILVATCDANLRPEGERGVGAVVGADRESLTVFVSEALSRRTRDNLVTMSEVAVTFSRPFDLRSIQVKGRRTRVRAATLDERPILQRYLGTYIEQLHMVGVARALSRRIRHWPALAIEIEIRELFSQTPGAGAGARIEARR